MSRIGLKPIVVPSDVEVKVDGNSVTVKGPKGTLVQEFDRDMTIKLEGQEITVARPSEEKEHKSIHGLTRSLIANMIDGVVNGYKKELEINGVGYRAAMQGKDLVLSLGFSHPVVIPQIDGITIEVPTPNKLVISGIDKQLVGFVASDIRSKRPPEPYKGKGIKYVDEVIIRKDGKAGKK